MFSGLERAFQFNFTGLKAPGCYRDKFGGTGTAFWHFSVYFNHFRRWCALCRVLFSLQLLFSWCLCLQENFEEMCQYQASGRSHVLVLTKGMFGETIIEEWLEILGPPDVAEAQENAATRCVCTL